MLYRLDEQQRAADARAREAHEAARRASTAPAAERAEAERAEEAEKAAALEIRSVAHLWDQVNDDAEGAKVTELFLGNFTLGVKLQAAFRGALERRRKRLGGGQ